MVDAEQSYTQLAIESITEQLQLKYNRKRAYILPTIQNYLKRSTIRADYEVRFCQAHNLKFGAKLVRGAYLVEETELAEKEGRENPVVDCFEDTTSNYLGSFERMVSSVEEGEVIVATHNQDTVEDVIAIKAKYKKTPQVGFAQLLGLADHLTAKLNSEGWRVYKYLPWA